jgi:hypothetical protein
LQQHRAQLRCGAVDRVAFRHRATSAFPPSTRRETTWSCTSVLVLSF